MRRTSVGISTLPMLEDVGGLDGGTGMKLLVEMVGLIVQGALLDGWFRRGYTRSKQSKRSRDVASFILKHSGRGRL